MKIRPATQDDVEALYALYAYYNYHPGVPRDSTRQSIQAAIGAAHVYFIVLEDENISTDDTGHIVGAMCFNEIVHPSQPKRKGFVDDGVVHPAARNRGYAEQLYLALESEARRRGFARFIFTASPTKRVAMTKVHARMGHPIRAHAIDPDDTNYYDHELTT